jgi:molybdenum cofactor cytidylyltransferase
MHFLDVHAIVLAGGSSVRLGQPKQLVVFKGETLLGRAVQTALAANISSVSVVVGPHASLMGSELKSFSEVALFQNERHQEGLSSSIRAGVQGILPRISRHPFALLFLLCDQPLLTTEHLNQLIALAHTVDEPLIASLYGARPGVPALFSSSYATELCSLPCEHGAKSLFTAHCDKLKTVPFPEGEFDIDTPADLLSLKEWESRADSLS